MCAVLPGQTVGGDTGRRPPIALPVPGRALSRRGVVSIARCGRAVVWRLRMGVDRDIERAMCVGRCARGSKLVGMSRTWSRELSRAAVLDG